jgi:hypothetical protein
MFDYLLNKEINSIIVSGYTENINGKYFFQPMYSWIFLEIKNNEFAKFSSNDGDITVNLISEVNCPFEIEESDIFTFMYISDENLGIITNIEYIRDRLNNLIEINIITDKKNIRLNSLTIDGFEVDIVNLCNI